ncbi:MAG: glycosyltransferase family 4 protein [Bacteroidota bacterium]
MKFLLNSTTFYPAVGGLENVAMDIALEFVRAGHEVKVVTLIPRQGASEDFPFDIIRKPSFFKYIQLIRWADAALHFNVTTKGILPHVLLNTPLIISHQSPIKQTGKKKTKVWIANKVPILNIGCSRYVAEQYENSIAIHNSYNHQLFRNLMPMQDRKGELVYLGRLVSIKGVDTLLEALHLLQKEGLTPKLTIIGDGEDRSKLEAMSQRLGLHEQVQFVGKKLGEALVASLNQHKIMVVPSKWNEAFGIVALEGIACGLALIASEGGGLIDAVGPCGITFPNGNAVALAAAIKQVWNQPEQMAAFQQQAPEHLKQHERDVIAKKYLEVIENALRQ